MSEVAEKRAVFLQGAKFGPREHKRQDWVVEAEAGTKIEDVLDPQYWAHVAAQMEPHARIEVLAETGEWMLELIALNVGRNWAQVHVLHRYELEKPADAMPAAQRSSVEWKGPTRKWAVIRLSDNQILQDGFASKAEGQGWAVTHERNAG